MDPGRVSLQHRADTSLVVRATLRGQEERGGYARVRACGVTERAMARKNRRRPDARMVTGRAGVAVVALTLFWLGQRE